MSADRKYEARQMVDDEEVSKFVGTPKEIATKFGLLHKAQVETVCQWADDEQCVQGIARGAVESILIEPGEEVGS